MLTELLTAFLILLFVKLISKCFQKPKDFPPGPPHLPIIGSFPFLAGRGLEKIVGAEVASYGPVTGLYAGAYPLVMINDWKLAKSLFSREEFSGRPW